MGVVQKGMGLDGFAVEVKAKLDCWDGCAAVAGGGQQGAPWSTGQDGPRQGAWTEACW